MPSFGFSAFLKMLSLNERPRRTQMRSRLLPSDGGYDFHKSFRRFAARYLAGGEPLETLLAEADALTRAAEARSARAALEYLEEWRGENPGQLLSFSARTYESPGRRFKVHYTPDFGMEIDGVRVAIHIWNTVRTELDLRMTYAALALFPDLYGDDEAGPQDLAVLSVPHGRLYRLSDVADQALLAQRMVASFETLIDGIREEIGSDRPPAEPDQPSAR